MIRRFWKSGMAITLALTMTILPCSVVNAQTKEITSFSDTTTQITPTISPTITPTIAPTSAPEQVGTYDGVIKQANTKANLLTSMYGSTSVQYAIIDEGKIIVSGTAGVYHKENSISLTKEHMYGVGSISKTFTAAAIMQLVEKGKLELDAPVVKYLPKFKMADDRYKKITVRMLLNHSSGLMGSSFVMPCCLVTMTPAAVTIC